MVGMGNLCQRSDLFLSVTYRVLKVLLIPPVCWTEHESESVDNKSNKNEPNLDLNYNSVQ